VSNKSNYQSKPRLSLLNQVTIYTNTDTIQKPLSRIHGCRRRVKLSKSEIDFIMITIRHFPMYRPTAYTKNKSDPSTRMVEASDWTKTSTHGVFLRTTNLIKFHSQNGCPLLDTGSCKFGTAEPRNEVWSRMDHIFSLEFVFKYPKFEPRASRI
jgi:hypothetical protein